MLKAGGCTVVGTPPAFSLILLLADGFRCYFFAPWAATAAAPAAAASGSR